MYLYGRSQLPPVGAILQIPRLTEALAILVTSDADAA